MHRQILGSIAALGLFAALPAHASGIYLGGGIGSASIEDNAGNQGGIRFDESDTAYKLFAGYRFDWLPIVSLSAELGYRDLGSPDATRNGVSAEYDVDGFDYAALAGLGLGPIELFARVGGFSYDLEKRVGGVSSDFDGNAPVYGVGARFSLFGVGIRAEYENIDIDELESSDMVSVSAFFQF